MPLTTHTRPTQGTAVGVWGRKSLPHTPGLPDLTHRRHRSAASPVLPTALIVHHLNG